MEAISVETAELAAYIANSREMTLPDAVVERATLHICDALAAIVSGSAMPAGRQARTWFEVNFGQTTRQPTPQATGGATVLGHGLIGTPLLVATCNGMSAHADETDDSHAPSLSHPGCSVVPTALALGEALGRSGEDLLRAVVIGYDVGCRIGRSIQSAGRTREVGRWSSHAVVGTFCSAAAAATLFRLDADQARHLLSYAAQLCSGVTTWVRDSHHVEKAFVFAGMPANHGVLAASLVASGCDGVEDVFAGSPNFLEAMSEAPETSQLNRGLGEEFEIMQATIKKYAVGSPSQAAIEATIELIAEHGLRAEEVGELTINLPADSAVIVDNRSMPNINVQYLVAGTLLDGGFSMAMSHDEVRMVDPAVTALMAKTRLIADSVLAGTRSATVTVVRETAAGSTRIERHVANVRGTPKDPMTWSEVRTKAEDLMGAVLGPDKARRACEAVHGLHGLARIEELTVLCAGNGLDRQGGHP